MKGGFATWGLFLVRRRWAVILLSLLVTGGFASGLGSLRVDASIESMLKQSDPTRVTYDGFRDQFGSDETVLLVVRAPTLFTLETLATLRALHRDLEAELPHLEELTSLVNARHTRGTDGEFVVEDLLEEWPRSELEAGAVRKRALANPSYRAFLISDDAQYTAITVATRPSGDAEFEALAGFEDEEPGPHGDVKILAPEQVEALMGRVTSIVERYDSEDFRIWVSGTPAVNFEIVKLLQRDMGRFTGIALFTIGLLLWAFFRRVSAVVLPLLVVALSLLSTVGGMGLTGLPLTPASQILPSFLIAVGVGYAVHLLSIFYGALDRGISREDALVHALGHSGRAVVLTSLTTAGSLASFQLSEMVLLSDFGIAAPAGVLLALAYSVVLMPALLAVLPIGARTGSAGDTPTRMDRLLVAFGDLGNRQPRLVVSAWALLFVVGVAGASQLTPSHSPVEWLPPDNPARRAVGVANEKLGGSTTIEVILDSGRENGFKQPEALRALAQLQEVGESLNVAGVRVGNSFSLAEIVKETHQALHANAPAYYAISNDPQLLAQELLLFESNGPEELEKVVDSQYRAARISLFATYGDALHYKEFLAKLREQMEPILPEGTAMRFTGLTLLSVRSFEAMLQGMVRSYAVALLVIVPIMMLLVGGVGRGLVSMIPNLVPIVFAMGAMHALGIPLDAFTVLIGSISIGVAVDDTIHFMHNFRRYHAELGDVGEAVRRTLLTTGRALLVTSVVLCNGFLVFAFASMENVINFGLVTAFTVSMAFLADVVLSPALVTLLSERRPAR